MNDDVGRVRPLAHAYLRAHLLMTETELADAKERLERFAAVEGYTLGTLFVERVDLIPAAYHALVDAIEAGGVAAVLVPTWQHLAVLGPPAVLRDHLQRTTGVRVVIASP